MTIEELLIDWQRVTLSDGTPLDLFIKGLCALTTFFSCAGTKIFRPLKLVYIHYSFFVYFIFGLSKKSAASLTKKLISSSPRPNLLLTVNDKA